MRPPSLPISRISALLLCCGLALLSAGCMGTFGRDRVPFEMPESFSMSGETEQQQRWWESFGSPRLNSLVERALHDNLSLNATAGKVAELEAMARIAGAPLVPTVAGSGDASSTRYTKTDTTTDSFGLGVAASWELDLWGRIRAGRNAATASLRAGEEELNAAALTIAAEVAQTWFARLENQGEQRLVTRQKETNSKTLQLIDIQVVTGNAGIADLLQQQQLVEANQTDLEALRGTAATLDHRLALLLGLPPGLLALSPRELPELPPLPATGIPLALVQRRPDVRAAFHDLEAADAEVAQAAAARFPTLTLSAGVSTTADSTAGLFNTWVNNFAAGLIAPIFNGGTLRATEAQKEAAARQAFYHYGQSVLEALEEVENALKTEEALIKQLTRTEKQLQLAGDSVRHIDRRYRQGSLEYQRVLSAILAAQQLQRQVLALQLQLLSNRITLYRALSGGLPPELLPAGDGGDTVLSRFTIAPLVYKEREENP